VLEACTRCLPPDHPDLLSAKENLAMMRYELGDLPGASELFEGVLASRTRLLPPDHPDVLAAELSLAATRYALGDLEGARRLVSTLLDGVCLRARSLRAEAARPARESARAELGRLFDSLSADSGPGLEPVLFTTLESLRLASVASVEAAHVQAANPELTELARGLAKTRTRLNDLAAAGAKDEASLEGWRRSLLGLAEERDRAERVFRGKLADAGAFVGEVDAKSVAARLASREAVASFLRYPKQFDKSPETGERLPSVESFLAFVVKPDATVHRVELGAASELEALVTEWRAALGRPLASRGVGGTEAVSDAEQFETLGTRLRERILDPIRTEVPALSVLHVVLDDLLFLVPLDALPLEGGFVGERIQVRNEVTLARLLRDQPEVAAEGSLTAAGGIDYGAELGAEALVRLDTATPPMESGTLRSGAAAGFVALLETSGEETSIAALYRAAFDREASIFSGSAATKAALFAAAPKTRFLHLATHGWFASESFKSQLDSPAESSARGAVQRAQETLTGFAPETLCGLALAGANRGKDSLGHVPGILTAEELATFDLRNCELAVLSACETNVGIRRAGQGIQSLQTALHAAGARTAITSLWKVDDAATRRLFELFYTKLWKEHLGKADALWQAKMALRAEGHPPRDWAGWVLSGDPD
jgi:CHAT domain-containing protein